MLHKEIPVGDRHAAHSFEYADAAARLAATGLVSTDIHKFGLQLDDGTYWRLVSISPLTWVEFGAKGADGTSVVLKGSVATVGDLPAAGNAVGDLYVVTADGNGYVLGLQHQPGSRGEYGFSLFYSVPTE